MAFELFKNPKSRGLSPKVSIRATGQMGFNKGSLIKYGINEVDYLTLFFDAEERRIGIQLGVTESDEGAIKINKRANDAYISARNFLDYYGIDHSKTRTGRLLSESTEFGDLLVLKIDEMNDRGSKKNRLQNDDGMKIQEDITAEDEAANIQDDFTAEDEVANSSEDSTGDNDDIPF